MVADKSGIGTRSRHEIQDELVTGEAIHLHRNEADIRRRDSEEIRSSILDEICSTSEGSPEVQDKRTHRATSAKYIGKGALLAWLNLRGGRKHAT
jgi:hypothetical protein